MLVKTGRINVRIDAELKASVDEVLAKLGLSAAEALRLFYRQVLLHQGLPFEEVIPQIAPKQRKQRTAQNKNSK